MEALPEGRSRVHNRPRENDLFALILSANRELRSAIAAVLEREGWTPDHMHPDSFEPYEEELSLLIVAPHNGDDANLADMACHDSLVAQLVLLRREFH